MFYNDTETGELHRQFRERLRQVARERPAEAAGGAQQPLGPRRPTVGDRVVVVEGDTSGCIGDGSIGVIFEDARDHQPYHVRGGADDDTYWYHEHQVQFAHGAVNPPLSCPTCYEALEGLGEGNDNGWRCDAAPDCLSGCTGFNQSDGWHRWRCSACDFDLCGECYGARHFGPALAGSSEGDGTDESDEESEYQISNN